MKTMMLPAGLVAAVVLATALPGQLMLVINTASGSSGDFCQAVTCAPDAVGMPAAFPTLQIAVAGAGFQPGFLLLALPPAQCLVVPGLGGTLNLQPPGVAAITNLTWGHFPSAPCATWQGLQALPLPAGLAPGMQLLAQVLFAAPNWTFSNAVLVTVQ
ncbi:MAG: hypothetical protein WAT39_14940 [Planctomycetota bacterium]